MVHVLSRPEFGPGSGYPRLAAANDPGTQEHAQMLQLLTGGKPKKNKWGGADASQFNLQYNPGSQNPNTIVTKLQETQLQSAENAKLDGALVSGGSRKKKNKTKTKTRKTKTRKGKNKSKKRTNRKKRR